ncbi:hypothetical protein LINGRAHAP2_LOCUS20167 [Linum grandiflorum]
MTRRNCRPEMPVRREKTPPESSYTKYRDVLILITKNKNKRKITMVRKCSHGKNKKGCSHPNFYE